MQDIEFCKELLKLDDNWSISEIDIDKPSKRLDITVRYGKPKKKYIFGRASNDNEQELITLRHMPIAGLRTYLHVPKPGTVASDKIWAAGSSPFTLEMEDHIIQTLNSCRSNLLAAKLLGISAAEAREISERTGTGTDVEPETATPAPVAAMPAATSTTSLSSRSFDLDSGELPIETDPSWQRLINGEIPIQSGVVGLQMLLQRVRQQIAGNPTETTRLSSARLLRQYFVKNAQQHPAELAYLKGAPILDDTVLDAGASDAIPAETAPCWQALIDGEMKIRTSEVGLQMMLERVRLSVERNPSALSRAAGIRILRQYFQKHQNRLGSEIEQMGGRRPQQAVAAVSTVAEPGGRGIPAENQPAWTRLINGEIRIDTNAVGLQMMLERVRLSVERNPTETSRQAGIKLLRQFFLKHRDRLQAEIRQLNGEPPGDSTMTGVSQPSTVALLPEQHENWRSLVDGKLRLNTDNVALQMMLERVRLTVERNPSETTRHAAIRILRQFFIKHRNRLEHEIRQLGGTTAGSAATVRAVPVDSSSTRGASVPPESHPSWQRLINGELEIKTDIVALKMMLERIRISINNNPTDASRLAGAKILRQYFLKHQNKHRAEIDQLLAA